MAFALTRFSTCLKYPAETVLVSCFFLLLSGISMLLLGIRREAETIDWLCNILVFLPLAFGRYKQGGNTAQDKKTKGGPETERHLSQFMAFGFLVLQASFIGPSVDWLQVAVRGIVALATAYLLISIHKCGEDQKKITWGFSIFIALVLGTLTIPETKVDLGESLEILNSWIQQATGRNFVFDPTKRYLFLQVVIATVIIFNAKGLCRQILKTWREGNDRLVWIEPVGSAVAVLVSSYHCWILYLQVETDLAQFLLTTSFVISNIPFVFTWLAVCLWKWTHR